MGDWGSNADGLVIRRRAVLTALPILCVGLLAAGLLAIHAQRSGDDTVMHCQHDTAAPVYYCARTDIRTVPERTQR